MALNLNIDDIVTRQQLNDSYGGGIQGGMLTPAGGKYIFVFSDPSEGHQYGYTWDGWANESLETFFYTGAGVEGDQEFTSKNLTLRNSAADGREVHLFIADGYANTSRARTHQYMGQFRVDETDPWRREEALDINGQTRSAIVFQLNRINTSPKPQTHRDALAQELPTRNSSEVVAPEASNMGEFNRAGQTESVASRRERSLEDAFHAHLRSSGGDPHRVRITIAGQAKPLYTDTFNTKDNELFEAKGSVSRHDVRLAIGQLLDYRRHITPPPNRCTVLLPSDPGEDLTSLIHSSGMDLIYQDGKSFTRKPASPERKKSVDLEAMEAARMAASSFPIQGRGHALPHAADSAVVPREGTRLPSRLTAKSSGRE